MVLLQQLERTELYIDRIETKFGVKFALGRNASIDFMAHLWEPLRWIHKPLALYLGAETMFIATDALLYAQGFRCHRQQVHVFLTLHCLPLLVSFQWHRFVEHSFTSHVTATAERRV